MGTERFPLIFEALSALKVTTCLIDGEAVACTETGLAEFEFLRARRGDVHLCAFDLLELDGRDLRLEHFAKRRRLLAPLVRKPRSGLVLNAVFEQEGPLVFEHACLLGCEGIVSKRKHSRYRSGRSRDWAISGEKDGNLRVVYARIGRAKVVLLGEVLKLRWRGPTPPLRVTLG
jgi:bifunctional non-homologous end joining protein LigD